MGTRRPTSSHPVLARILLGAVFMLASHALLRASDVTLAWDANTETDLKGYKVYYGSASGSYSETIDVGNVTTYTVPNLEVGIYFFAVTAYNASGLESGFSNEVFKVIPSQTFYYPHLPFSSSTEGIDNPVLTGVALTNPGSASAAVEVTAFDVNGNLLTGTGVTNPNWFILQPGEQLSAIDSQNWFHSDPAADSIAYVKVDAAAPILGFFEILNNKLTILSGAEFAFPPSALGPPRTTVFPAIQAGGTRIHLVNANSDSASVILQLLDVTGAQIGWAMETIAAKSALVADAFSDLFPGAIISGSEYIRVTAPSAVLPYEYIRGPSDSLQVLGAQDVTNGSTTLYAPQYAVGGDWRTTLSVVNLDSIDGSVTFTLYPDGGGTVISLIVPVSAGSKIEITNQSFFMMTVSAPTQGYLAITSSVHLIGHVVFGDSAGTAFSTTLPLVSNLDNAAFFGQMASDSTFYTGIAVVNPQDSPTSIGIEIFQSDGSLAAPPATIMVPARQRSIGMLTDFFPGLASQSSGYIQITGSQAFASFVLYGTRNLTALSAVPAQQIIR